MSDLRALLWWELDAEAWLGPDTTALVVSDVLVSGGRMSDDMRASLRAAGHGEDMLWRIDYAVARAVGEEAAQKFALELWRKNKERLERGAQDGGDDDD